MSRSVHLTSTSKRHKAGRVAKRRAGRPPKVNGTSKGLKRKASPEEELCNIPKKRGRKPKKKIQSVVKVEANEEVDDDERSVDTSLSNHSTTSSSDDSMEGYPDEWSTETMKAYRKARMSYEEIVIKKFKSCYNKAFEEPHTYSLGQLNIKDIEPLNFAKDPKDNSVTLEYFEPLPPMIFWSLTEMNITADDETTLSHVPYISELEDEEAFTKELMNAYPDGIHGTLTGCGEYMNDYILYFTIKNAQNSINDIEKDQLYRIIYELFPNKTPKTKIRDIIPDLEARFDPERTLKQNNFDNAGFLKAYAKPAELIHSYESLQCCKCTFYDCPHHINHAVDIKRRNKNIEFDPLQLPCGPDCYLKNDSSFSSTVFIPHERSLIDLMVESSDWCTIAMAIQLCTQPGEKAKTCRDVYEYVRKNHKDIVDARLLQSQVKRQKENGKKRDDHIHRQFRMLKWNEDGAVQNKHAYIPCDHTGLCEEQQDPPCPCWIRDKICTKYCKCYHDGCKLQFPGCKCNPGNCGTRACSCYFANWECDPDLCQNCRCGPDDKCGSICKNTNFQKGLQKRLCAQPSQMAGWGCFAVEDIARNEFIAEYTGEIITASEGDRRGKIYDKYNMSYLFEINQEYHVDATKRGNIIRFANHSSENPNCCAKVIVVNTDHRIGIFACKDIKKGEELFFNYSYNQQHRNQFLNKEVDKSGRIVTISDAHKKDNRGRKRKEISAQ